MKQKHYAILALFTLLSANALASEPETTSNYSQGMFAENGDGSSTAGKQIETKDAGGGKQTTVIDVNGNLKMIEKPGSAATTSEDTNQPTGKTPPPSASGMSPTAPTVPTPPLNQPAEDAGQAMGFPNQTPNTEPLPPAPLKAPNPSQSQPPVTTPSPLMGQPPTPNQSTTNMPNEQNKLSY